MTLKQLKQSIWRAIHGLGYSIRRNDESDYPDQKRLFIDTPVDIVFDLGANRGNTVAQYRKLFPAAVIHAFEPIPQLASHLRGRFASDDNVKVHQCAVSNKTGGSTFHVNSAIDTSSLLSSPQQSTPSSYRPLMNTTSMLSVDTITLDEACVREGIESIDILKMDVQGAELPALEGAKVLLSNHRIQMIYTELFFQPFYQDQPLFGDVAAHLGCHGYVLHNAYNLAFRGGSGKCGWTDAIFIAPHLRDISRRMLVEDAML